MPTAFAPLSVSRFPRSWPPTQYTPASDGSAACTASVPFTATPFWVSAPAITAEPPPPVSVPS